MEDLELLQEEMSLKILRLQRHNSKIQDLVLIVTKIALEENNDRGHKQVDRHLQLVRLVYIIRSR